MNKLLGVTHVCGSHSPRRICGATANLWSPAVRDMKNFDLVDCSECISLWMQMWLDFQEEHRQDLDDGACWFPFAANLMQD